MATNGFDRDENDFSPHMSEHRHRDDDKASSPHFSRHNKTSSSSILLLVLALFGPIVSYTVHWIMMVHRIVDQNEDRYGLHSRTAVLGLIGESSISGSANGQKNHHHDDDDSSITSAESVSSSSPAVTILSEDEQEGQVDRLLDEKSYNKKYQTWQQKLMTTTILDDTNDDDEDGSVPSCQSSSSSVITPDPWYMKWFVTCNNLHEIDLLNFSASPITYAVGPRDDETIGMDNAIVFPRIMARGADRDVWIVRDFDFGENVVLKTWRFRFADTEHVHLESNRREAAIHERLTSSPVISQLYASCGTSGIHEYAAGGDLNQLLWQHSWSSRDKLKIALQLAETLAVVHNLTSATNDYNNNNNTMMTRIVHGDISPGQFLWSATAQSLDKLVIKIHDFTRSVFLGWNNETRETCPFLMGYKIRKRSPEEYQMQALNEKIDVYALGNIFFTLLTGRKPFEGLGHADFRQHLDLVENVLGPDSSSLLPGPPIPPDTMEQLERDPILQILQSAMLSCHKPVVQERATAVEVATYLQEQLRALDDAKGDDDKKDTD